MYQSSWPGIPSRPIDPMPAPVDGGAARTLLPVAEAPLAGDGIAQPWYAANGQSGAPFFAGGAFGSGGLGFGLLGQLQSLLGMLQQTIASALQGMGANGSAAQNGASPGWQQPPAGGRQYLRDGDLSSTGDPHLAETATGENGAAISKHIDSMTAHGDLIDAQIPGGYRVSTQVTAPQTNGVTYNKSVTVTDGRDRITMDAGGAVAIDDDGRSVGILKGQSLTLSGGEMVTENSDGSVIVTATNDRGGSIATTMRTNGSGVDVTAHVHDLAVGGDIVDS